MKSWNNLLQIWSEYGSCVRDSQGVVLQEEIEKDQNRASRFVASTALKLEV